MSSMSYLITFLHAVYNHVHCVPSVICWDTASAFRSCCTVMSDTQVRLCKLLNKCTHAAYSCEYTKRYIQSSSQIGVLFGCHCIMRQSCFYQLLGIAPGHCSRIMRFPLDATWHSLDLDSLIATWKFLNLICRDFVWTWSTSAVLGCLGFYWLPIDAFLAFLGKQLWSGRCRTQSKCGVAIVEVKHVPITSDHGNCYMVIR
jgi:hypothetical protein